VRWNPLRRHGAARSDPGRRGREAARARRTTMPSARQSRRSRPALVVLFGSLVILIPGAPAFRRTS